MIHLIGPGGAGKTTVGASLAVRLGMQFVDLDSEFISRVGDISQQIDGEGYETYARNNVETYISIADYLEACVQETVRRQLTRPFVRSAAREEAVIRERYATYISVPAPKVDTMRSVDEVVDAIVGLLPPNTPLEQTPDASLAGGTRRRTL